MQALKARAEKLAPILGKLVTDVELALEEQTPYDRQRFMEYVGLKETSEGLVRIDTGDIVAKSNGELVEEPNENGGIVTTSGGSGDKSFGDKAIETVAIQAIAAAVPAIFKAVLKTCDKRKTTEDPK